MIHLQLDSIFHDVPNEGNTLAVGFRNRYSYIRITTVHTTINSSGLVSVTYPVATFLFSFQEMFCVPR